MEFKKLPANSKRLLDEIVRSENPTQLLRGKFQNLSTKEDEELRGIIRELCQSGYINIPMWADNVPYHVVVNNVGRTYNEQLAEYEEEKRAQQGDTYTIGTVNDQCVTIGDSNKINKSIIVGKKKEKAGNSTLSGNTMFYERHPIICGFLISLAAGLVLLFSFWSKIISFIEGAF